MTNEDLLQPRWKVIGDYPKSLYHVGDILNGGWRSEDLIYCDTNGPRWRHYPHLFKELEWWEEREENCLPNYLSYKFMSDSVPKIVKVERHLMSSFGVLNKKGFLCEYGEYMSYSKTLPATKKEYSPKP